MNNYHFEDMKKIMFSERYGLEQAVLAGTKTMTRRICTMTLHRKMKDGTMEEIEPNDMFIASDGTALFQLGRNGYRVPKENQPAYKIGEEIAIAQPYKQCWDFYQKQWEAYNDPSSWRTPDAILGDSVQETAGWTNKMFVKADMMPHSIRIADIKVERLQDITEQECIYEGIKIKKGNRNGEYPFGEFTFDGWDDYSFTARDAFAVLIDKISGNGTWNNNPWVFVYKFELMH